MEYLTGVVLVNYILLIVLGLLEMGGRNRVRQEKDEAWLKEVGSHW